MSLRIASVFLLLLLHVGGSAAADKTIRHDVLYCVRMMKGDQGDPGVLFDSEDAIGCTNNPNEVTEKPCALSGQSECTFSECQEVILPNVPNGRSVDDAEFCGIVPNRFTGKSLKLWCYYNEIVEQSGFAAQSFCVAVNEIWWEDRPAENKFECRGLDLAGSVVVDFGRVNLYVFLKPGPCSKGGIQKPNIYEGASNESLDDLNKQISAGYECPFETLPPANTDDSRITKIETHVCQAGTCLGHEEFLLTGERVEIFGPVVDGSFMAQRRQDQVCLTFPIRSNEGWDFTDEPCGSACVQVGSSKDLYAGKSSLGAITNVAMRSFDVSDQQTSDDDDDDDDDVGTRLPLVTTSAPVPAPNGSVMDKGRKANYTWWILLATGGGLLLILSTSRNWSRYRSNRDYQRAHVDVHEMELTTMADMVST
jgi:hypothetical protein